MRTKPLRVGKFAEAFQVAGLRFYDADVLQHGLGDEGGHVISFDERAHGFEVVELDGVHERAFGSGNAGGERDEWVFVADDLLAAELLGGVHQVRGNHVLIAVVAALHEDDVVAAGGGSGDADRLGGSFGTGVEELNFVGGRHAF